MRSRSVLVGAGIALAAAAAASAVRAPSADAGTETADPRREAVIELGRRLFMDPTVSRLGKNSCASCHDPERGFSDPRRVSLDDDGPTLRHSQTLVDLAGEGFHWDGEFRAAREIVVARVAPAAVANEQTRRLQKDRLAAARAAGVTPDPLVTPGSYVVMAADTPDATATPVADRLAADRRYAEAFEAAFGDAKPTTDRVLDAIDAYCASLRSSTNAFDRFRAGDTGALSPAARRGLSLFEGRAGCVQCHLTQPKDGRAPMTDGRFHDTGIAARADAAEAPGVRKRRSDLGRQDATFLPADACKFKTPTLRDVARRGPYMHDGSMATLADVVRYYSGGATPHAGLDPVLKRLDLSDAEAADLVAFLESLTGGQRAGLGAAPAKATPLRVRVTDMRGEPMSAFTFDVEPFGDRLVGAARAAPTSVTTDARGEAEIVRPATTHVRLTSATHWIGSGAPIPDTCASIALTASPPGKITVRVRRLPSWKYLPDDLRVVTTLKEDAEGRLLATLKPVGSVDGEEAAYTGDALRGAAPRRCFLEFGLGSNVTADVPLGGGEIETVVLR